MGREARNNPTAIKAKRGEIPPKPKRPSKREENEFLHYAVMKSLQKHGLWIDDVKKSL